uniref:DUF2254 domain-containing protein n=1 Tax=Candidatus Methanogaster sp. ANME-2c ERB4 TaxID=2759911 RepID=A0A7G9YFY7_9EURY|nr:hypothetical protein GBMLOPDG_00017 [Methanosarcinales archaeon ANME-2c ERB4]
MYNHLWIKIFMYGIIVFIAFIFMRILIHFNLFYIESDSAKYLLSALVQSEAAIIGIVITLTFITVQLIFSYAPQAVGVALKKNYDMWILLFFYGLSISYGLFVLRMIPNKWNGSLDQLDFLTLWGSHVSLEYRICFAYCLGVSAFVAIAPYILNTVDFLKPANIIKILSRDITEYKILRHIKSMKEHKENRTIPVKEDPFQPIMGIINGSVMKSDTTMLRCGLETVINKAVDIIDLYKYSDNEDIPMYFCDHLERAGKYVLQAEDDESAIEIIGCLKNIGILAIKMPSDKAVKTSAQYIEMLGSFAAEKKLRFVTCDAVESLEAIGEFAVQNRLEDAASQVTDSIGTVGMYAAENKIGVAAQYAAKYLGRVGMCAAENELKYAALKAAESLGVVGTYAAENELKYAASKAAESLGDVGKAAAEKGLEDATDQAARSLGDVGKTAERNGLEKAVGQALESLGQVGKIAAENGLRGAAASAAMDLVFFGRFAIDKGNDYTAERVIWFLEKIGKTEEKGKQFERVTWQAAKSLGLLGMDAAEKGKEFENVTNKVLWHLASIGRSAEGQGLEKATKQVAQSFIDIGVFAVKNGLDGTAQEAAKSLAELTISSERIVKVAIQELEQEERYPYALQKFMKLYEQQLEKLRTQNPD